MRTTAQSPKDSTTMPTKPPLYIITNNHFDLTWRRCWQRRFVFRNQVFASYADLEDWYLSDNLALARRHPGYAFETECAAVVREFVRRHPERLPELRRLTRTGRFAVNGAGDNIVDSNLITGESLVRNFVNGLLWVEEHLGLRTAFGARYDAFGNSAQLPQILRGCGLDWVNGLTYSGVRGKFWRGLDGSTVCCAELPMVGWGGGIEKYPPCPQCHGHGCRICAGRGIDLSLRSRLPDRLDDRAIRAAGAACVRLAPEELLPNPAVIAWARSLRSRYAVRFAVTEAMRPHHERWLKLVDRPPKAELHPGVELNPNNCGTWVTRIRTKQQCRRQEYALLGAESICALAALDGASYPRDEAKGIWALLHFTMFHDAITGTHVDAAHEEIKAIWDRIDSGTARLRDRALGRLVQRRAATVSAINPFGQATSQLATALIRTGAKTVRLKDERGRQATVVSCRKAAAGVLAVEFVARDVPALGAKTWEVRPARPATVRALRSPVIHNERFRIVADGHGLLSVYDRRLKRDILAAGAYRPNELILEHDEGSPWHTLKSDFGRVPLAQHTRLVAAEAGSGFQRLIFQSTPPEFLWAGGRCCDCRTTVTLHAGLERVDVDTQVRWDAFNARLRVAMPVAGKGKHLYGIPYGMLERRPYEPNFDYWRSANGDWPAVNWAGVQARGFSVALLNRGLPSYKVEAGQRGREVILLSLLRSPVTPTHLHEPWSSYTMTDYDGMRDAGEHRFAYALTAYNVPFAASAVIGDAEGYNGALVTVSGEARLPAAPQVHSDNVRLAALKWAERGKALVLRLVEYRGRRGTAEVILPLGAQGAARVDLLEHQLQPLLVRDGRVRLKVRAWEIATLRVDFPPERPMLPRAPRSGGEEA
jgi:alpha-mannosidase